MRTIDTLLEKAEAILETTTLPFSTRDDETVMDYLAERPEFMLLVDEAAATALGRPSSGAGDQEFEKMAVAFMNSVQSRLREAALVEAAVSPRRGPAAALS